MGVLVDVVFGLVALTAIVQASRAQDRVEELKIELARLRAEFRRRP